MWVLLITTFQCWAVTSPCKISCLRFICTQADLLSQRKHCISGTNVSLPSAVSQAWKRMNTNINLLSVHPRFILICPLCSPLIPSCLLPFTFFSLSPLIIHVYIPRPDIEKDWLARSLDKGEFYSAVFCYSAMGKDKRCFASGWSSRIINHPAVKSSEAG